VPVAGEQHSAAAELHEMVAAPGAAAPALCFENVQIRRPGPATGTGLELASKMTVDVWSTTEPNPERFGS